MLACVLAMRLAGVADRLAVALPSGEAGPSGSSAAVCSTSAREHQCAARSAAASASRCSAGAGVVGAASGCLSQALEHARGLKTCPAPFASCTQHMPAYLCTAGLREGLGQPLLQPRPLLLQL